VYLVVNRCKLYVTREGLAVVSELINTLCEKRDEQFANARVIENIMQEILLQQERRLYKKYRDNIALSQKSLFNIQKSDCEIACNNIITVNQSTVQTQRIIGFNIA